jgi:hypothetical protein
MMLATNKIPITNVYKDIQYIPAKGASRYTTLITTYSDVEAYHLEHFLRHNTDTDIYIISDIRPDVPGIWGGYKWKNNDVLLREWWCRNRIKIKTNRLLYMEYDVLITTKITDSMFVDGVRTSTNFSHFKDIAPEDPWDKAGWWWGCDGSKLPYILKKVATATIPSIMWFNSKALDCLVLPEWDDVFCEDIISEIRLATILNYHNISLYDWDTSIAFMRNCAQPITFEKESDVIFKIKNFEPGIYHPVKVPVEQFFNI